MRFWRTRASLGYYLCKLGWHHERFERLRLPVVVETAAPYVFATESRWLVTGEWRCVCGKRRTLEGHPE